MRNRQGPRDIDISRARRAQRPRRSGAYRASAAAAQTSPAQHSVQPAQRASQVQQRPVQPAQRPAQRTQPAAHRPDAAGAKRAGAVNPSVRPAAQSSASKKRRRSRKKTALYVLLSVFAVFAVALGGLYWYVSSYFQTGEGGQISQTFATAPEYQGEQLNLLVLGIDYDDEDAVKRSEIGMTDMILYAQFNKKENSLKLLQITRDAYVGPNVSTGGTGKINALYANGPDKENRVQNLAEVLYDQLGLPVDSYVTIDMKALREVVDLFGGIEVYIPQDIISPTGSALYQGVRNLDGASVEFFLRERKSLPGGDYDRMLNQRYFYSALFKRVRTMTWQEMVKLMPVFRMYVNTDLSAWDCAALGVQMLSVPNENITMGRLPVYTGQEYYNGQLVSEIARQETADMLNTYFRAPEAAIPAEQLNIYSIGASGEVLSPEMSVVSGDGDVAAAESTPSSDAAQSADGQPAA